MDLAELLSSGGEWLKGTGPESDIVISSRIRLARNVEGYPFLPQLTREKRTELEARLREKISAVRIPSNGAITYLNLNETPPIDRHFLVERHLISREHANTDGDRGVAFTEHEVVSIMTNEEDHLRLQVLHSGLQLDNSWKEIDDLDNLLEREIRYAFHPRFGYLTACPTNVGSGMRVSVMLHLPALVMSSQIEKVFRAAAKTDLNLRGLYGEGTQASGNFYQISNQVTLGKAEEKLLEKFKSLIPSLIEFERKVRERMISDNRKMLEDKVWRAFGTLRETRTISSEETMELLSLVRLGVNLSLIPNVPINRVNDLFLLTQPAHLQKLEGRPLKPQDRDVARANLLRGKLQG